MFCYMVIYGYIFKQSIHISHEENLITILKIVHVNHIFQNQKVVVNLKLQTSMYKFKVQCCNGITLCGLPLPTVTK